MVGCGLLKTYCGRVKKFNLSQPATNWRRCYVTCGIDTLVGDKDKIPKDEEEVKYCGLVKDKPYSMLNLWRYILVSAKILKDSTLYKSFVSLKGRECASQHMYGTHNNTCSSQSQSTHPQ